MIEHGIGQREIPPINYGWNRYNRSRSCKGVMQHATQHDPRMDQTMDHGIHGYYRSISDEERSASMHWPEANGLHFIAESTLDLPMVGESSDFDFVLKTRCDTIREKEFADTR